MRTSNLVIFNPCKDLPLEYGNTGDTGGTTRALGNKAPGAIGGPALSDRTAAHGVVPESNVVALLIDVAATVSVYFWNTTWLEWVKGGAAAADYSKAIEARGQWAFTGQEGTPFYLVSDNDDVTRATLYASQTRE